jgi:hypothetical protein
VVRYCTLFGGNLTDFLLANIQTESENLYRNKAVSIANTTQGTSNVDFRVVHADKSTAMDKELQEIIEKGGVMADKEGQSIFLKKKL